MRIRPSESSSLSSKNSYLPVEKTAARSTPWWAAALCVSILYVAPGCGGGPPPPPGAKKEIANAEESLGFAENSDQRGMLNEALANVKDASRNVTEGKAKATENEKRKLRGLEDTINEKIADLETRIAAAKAKREKEAEEAALKAQVKAKGASEDPEVIKKREAAEAKALAEKQKQADMATLTSTSGNTGLKPKIKEEKKEDDEGGTAAPAPGTATAGGAGDAGKKEVKPAQTGPFKALAEKPGAIQVDLVTGKGDAAYAYIQIYNSKPDKNRRIGRVMVRFRDAGNTELFDADIVCQYDKFDPNQKDILDQNAPGAMLGMETHEIANLQSLKLIAVAGQQKADKVARAKRAMVTVVWSDGGENTEVGPSTMGDDKPGGKSGVMPGL